MANNPGFFKNNIAAMSSDVDPASVHTMLNRIKKNGELAGKLPNNEGCNEAVQRIEKCVDAIHKIMYGPQASMASKDSTVASKPESTESEQTNANSSDTSYRF